MGHKWYVVDALICFSQQERVPKLDVFLVVCPLKWVHLSSILFIVFHPLGGGGGGALVNLWLTQSLISGQAQK